MNICDAIGRKACTGCMVCKEVCPVNAIKTNIGYEGYYEPCVINEKCIECGKCVLVCPVYQKPNTSTMKKVAYIFQNSNSFIRKDSSSGGFFTAVAEYIINNGGIVYGAAFDKEWTVKHISVNDIDNLHLLRGSKYVQSDLSGIFSKIKSELREEKIVCFSGTPCQVAGLKKRLGKEYENLLLIDVVCHGVGSPKLWKRYIDNLHSVFKKIDVVSFRSKIYGYAASTMFVRSGRKVYTKGKNIQSYKMLFFKGYNLRPSCFQCNFKGEQRHSDLTIFDCWHMNQYDKSLDDDKGTTSILVNSRKGEDLINILKRKYDFQKVDRYKLIKIDGDMLNQYPHQPKDINQYWIDFSNGFSVNDLINKYCPYDIKKRIRVSIKIMLGKLHILKFFRK